MSRLVSRILLSLFVFPLGGLLYVFVFVAGETTLLRGLYYRRGEAELFTISDLLTWLFVAIYWLLVWRSAVTWNRTRIVLTIASFPATAIVGVLAAALAVNVAPMSEWGFAAFIGGVFAILLWLITSVFLWRETVAERAARVRAKSQSAIACPTCGYNLTGLSESRCPECGGKFTLDELFAFQPKADADVES